MKNPHPFTPGRVRRTPLLALLVCLWGMMLGGISTVQAQSNPSVVCNGGDCINTYSLNTPVEDVVISNSDPDGRDLGQNTYGLTSGIEIHQLYMKLNVTDLPSESFVYGAKLTFKVDGTPTVPDNKMMLVPLTSDWNPTTVSWNSNIPEDYNRYVYGRDVAEGVEFDLSYLMENWVSNPSENYGFAVLLDYSQESYANLESAENSNPNLRPELTVEYVTAQTLASGAYEMDISRYKQEQVFGNLDATPAQGTNPNIIMEFSMLGFVHTLFDGIVDGSLVDKARKGDWINILASLSAGAVNGSVALPQYADVLPALEYARTTEGEYPVMVVDHLYHHFKEDALENNLIEWTGTTFLDVPGRTESPFAEARAFALASFEEYIEAGPGGIVTWTLPSDAFITDANRSLQIDFGDGVWRNAVAGQDYPITYTQEGRITLKLRETATSREVHSEAYLFMPLPQPGDFTVNTGGDLWTVSYQGSTVATVKIYQEDFCGAAKPDITKPFILVEGFDTDPLGGDPKHEEYRNKLLIRDGYTDAAANITDRWLLDRLYGAGFDIMVVDLQSNWERLQFNGVLLRALIAKVNEVKAGDSPNQLMGFSMGGLISRYALRSMELAGEDHQVANYFSYDSPHQGAYYPLGILQLGTSLVNDTKFIPTGGPFEWFLGDLLEAYESDAASTMSVLSAKVDEEYDLGQPLYGMLDPRRAQFYTELAAMGFPAESTNYGISNGARMPIAQTKRGGGAMGSHEEMLEFHINLFDFLGLDAKVWTLPDQSATDRKTVRYAWSTGILKRIFSGPIANVLPTIDLKRRVYSAPPDVYPYEMMPGGYIEPLGSGTNGLNTPWLNDFGIDKTCFVPTVSALALTNQQFGPSAPSYFQSTNMLLNFSSDEGLAFFSPFDKVITDANKDGDPENHPHIEGVSYDFAEFIWDAVSRTKLEGVARTENIAWSNLAAMSDDGLYTVLNIGLISPPPPPVRDPTDPIDPVNPPIIPIDPTFPIYPILMEESTMGGGPSRSAEARTFSRSLNLDPSLSAFYTTTGHYSSSLPIVYTTPPEFWDSIGADLYEVIVPDFGTSGNVFYLKHQTSTGMFLIGNMCTNELYGFYQDVKNRLNTSPIHWMDSLAGLKKYHSIGGHYTLDYESSAGVTVGADASLTTSVLGNFDPDMQKVQEEFGAFRQNNRRAKLGGFNVLNVPDLHGEYMELEHGDPDAFWPQINLIWLEDAISRSDRIVGMTSRADKGAIYVGGNHTTNGRGDLSTMRYYGREVSTLEDNNYRYTSTGDFVLLPNNTVCRVDDNATADPYHVMDFQIPDAASGQRHHHRSEVTDQDITDIVDQQNSCALDGFGPLTLLRATIVKKGGATETFTLMSMDGQLDDSFADCNGYTYVSTSMANTSHFDLNPHFSCQDQPLPEHSAEVKLLGYLWDQMEAIPTDSLDHCGTIELISQGISCVTIQEAIQQFRGHFPEIMVEERDGGLSLFPPATPTNLTAVEVKADYVIVSWTDNSVNEWLFRVYGREPGTNGWNTQVMSAGENIEQDTIWGLTPGESYELSMRAQGDAGYSEYSNVITIDIPDGIPVPPTNLEVIDAGLDYLTVRYIDNATDEWGYTLEAKLPSAATWTFSTGDSENITEMTIWGLDRATTYDLRVGAGNGFGTGWSGVIQGTTNDGLPDAPFNLRATSVNEYSANLAWDFNNLSGNEVWTFQMRARLAGTTPWVLTSSEGENQRSGTMWSLDMGETYEMMVFAQNGYGQSTISNIITITTPITGLYAPTNLSTSNITSTSVLLNWTDNATIEEGFRITGRVAGTSGWPISIPINSANVEQGSITSLLPGTRYEFRVEALWGAESSGYSNTVSFTTLCPTPGNLSTSNVGTSTATVSWSGITNISSYRVDYRYAGQLNWNSKTVSTTSTSLSNLQVGTNYEVRVSAYCPNANIYGAFTAPASFGTTCIAPSGMQTNSTTSTTASFSWTGISGASNYKIRYSVQGSGLNTVQNVASTNPSYILAGLQSGKSYQAEVSGFCSTTGTWTAYSAPTTFATDCTAPTGMSASNVGPYSADLTWGSSDGGSSYQVHYQYEGQLNWNTKTVVGTSTTVTGLHAGTKYYFKARALCGATSEWTGFTATANVNTLCPAPGSVTVSDITYNSASVTWSGIYNPGKYRVQYRTDHEINWTSEVLSSNSGSLLLENLDAETNYEVRVNTWCPNLGIWSPATDIEYFTTLIPPPVAPNNFSVTATTESSVSLAWNDNADNEASFLLQWRETGQALPWNSYQTSVPANSTSYTVGGLEAGTGYDFRIRARNSSGTSIFRYQIGVYTDCGSTTLSVSNITHRAATFSWAPAPGITEYKVWWSRDGDAVFELEDGEPVTGTSYTVDSLRENSTYYYILSGLCNGNWVGLTTFGPTFQTDCAGPPSEVSANGIGTNSFTASLTFQGRSAWQVSPEAFQYRYAVADLGIWQMGSYTVAGVGMGDTYNFTIDEPGLFAGNDYIIQFRSFSTCDFGWTSWSQSANFSTDCVAPGTLGVTNIGSYSARLHFSEQGRATQYRVRYRIMPGILGNVETDSVSKPSSQTSARTIPDVSCLDWDNCVTTTGSPLDISGLYPLRQYEYQVQAQCGGSWTSFSTSDYFTTLPGCNIPTGLSSSNILYNSAVVSWSGDPEPTSWKIEYRRKGTSTWSSVSSSVTSRALTGLTYSTTYEFRVSALCSGIYTPPSAIAEFRTGDLCNIPGGLSHSVSGQTAYVSWGGVTGSYNYTLAYREQGASSWNTKIVSGTSSSFPASYCKSYEFKVRSTCASGYVTGYSAVRSVNANCPAPGAPGNASIYLNTVYNQATLHWSHPTSGGPVSYYEVYKNGSRLATISPNSTQYTTGFSCGTISMYVRAVNNGGASWSNTDTRERSPCAPSLYYQSINGNTVTLRWYDNSTNEDGFRIKDQNGYVIKTLSANYTQWSFYQSCNTSKQYRIEAYRSGQSSSYSGFSNWLYAGCPPEMPSYAYAYYSGTNVVVYWPSVSGATAYRVNLDGTWYSTTGTSYTFPASKFPCGFSKSFQVQAYNSYGYSGWKTGYFTGYAGASPSYINVSSYYQNQTVSWPYVSGTSYYMVQHKPSGGYWGSTKTVYGNSTTYYNQIRYKYHYYRVASVNGSGCISSWRESSGHIVTRPEEGPTADPIVEQVQIPEGDHMAVYPNPMDNGVATLAVKDLAGQGTLRVFNTLGEEVISHSVLLEGTYTELKLDLNTEASGMYIVQIELDGEVYRMRVMR